MYLSWYTLLFGAAIAATLPRLRATRFSDELRPGNTFITAVALLRSPRREAQRQALPSAPANLRVACERPAETELLLERLERLGYVRRLAAPAPAGATSRTGCLPATPKTMNLRPAFERFAVDPANTLLALDRQGVGAVLQGWDRARRLDQRAAGPQPARGGRELVTWLRRPT